ncbi:MAG: AraC family transcriptional regulator [Nevskia sp.]|nr:AraC family transcriptional regulator [Nevskia sp.]
MRYDDLARPSVPIAYGLLSMQVAMERGISRERILEATEIEPEVLRQPNGRLTLFQWGDLIRRTIELTRDYGLGYEFGARNNITAHGLFGYGMLSQSTVADAVRFAQKYSLLTTLAFGIHYFVEDGYQVLEVRDRIPYGTVRQISIDMCVASWWRMLAQCFGPLNPEFELWFEWPQPDYYLRYRERLPPTRFGTGVNRLRFPAKYLCCPINTANVATASMVTEQCERELAVILQSENIVERVRAALICEKGNYPDLEAVAERLYMSSRTLKRRLRENRSSFHGLLAEARYRDCIRLMADPTLRMDEIACRVGYSDPANFTRAFRRWMGTTPSEFRQQFVIPRKSGPARVAVSTAIP